MSHCGENPTITELIDYQEFCGIGDEPDEPQAHPDEVSVQDMKKTWTIPLATSPS